MEEGKKYWRQNREEKRRKDVCRKSRTRMERLLGENNIGRG